MNEVADLSGESLKIITTIMHLCNSLNDSYRCIMFAFPQAKHLKMDQYIDYSCVTIIKDSF